MNDTPLWLAFTTPSGQKVAVPLNSARLLKTDLGETFIDNHPASSAPAVADLYQALAHVGLKDKD